MNLCVHFEVVIVTTSDQTRTFEAVVSKQCKLSAYIANTTDNTRKLAVANVNVHVIDARVECINDY